MQLVLAFNDRATDVDANLLPLVDRLKLVCRIRNFQIYWFPRHTNRLAHDLAKRARIYCLPCNSTSFSSIVVDIL